MNIPTLLPCKNIFDPKDIILVSLLVSFHADVIRLTKDEETRAKSRQTLIIHLN